jgi:hypothetical protein
MMNPWRKSLRLVLPTFLLLTWTAWTGLWPAQKIYWHFTMKASWGEKAQEWAWITMVEMPKEQAYPEEAAQARSLGGQLRGYILAQVRAAAFRSSFEYEIKGLRCHDQPATRKVSWNSSQSDLVFAHGQIQAPTYTPEANRSRIPFRFGLCNNRVLMEDGRWRQLHELVNVFVGPIRLPGQEPEEMQGEFHALGINYDDPLRHNQFCGKSWAEPLETPLTYLEHDNLVEVFEESPDELTTVEFKNWHGFRVNILYYIRRSPEREHPFWKQMRMN